MSERIRGQEVLIRLSIDGVLQSGGWIKVTDFTLTPRTDLNETDFIGEDESDVDLQHHGFDFSGTMHELAGEIRQYLSQMVANHEAHVAPPNVTMMVQWGFRGAGAQHVVETYRKAVLKLDESSVSRKEFVQTKFSGKCRKYSAKAVASGQ